MTLQQLESYLWGAAVLLRGQIDASGYKEYIFPLMFFKRVSDVYDEQYNRYLEESDGDEDYARSQEYDIIVPEGAHWNDVRKVTENVGQALVDAFRQIEEANPPKEINGRMVGGLTGIFGDKSGWTNKNKMPDRIILSLIEHFSTQTLSLENCPADEMGLGYEYLIGQFANDAGHTAQEFYTNRTVVTLMAEILQPKPDESIYDPTCGSGGMLIKSLTYLKDHGKEWRGVQVYGQEVNNLTAAIARMNLYLHGIVDFSIANADTLKDPAFTRGDRLQQFDVVLANPPYSIKNWDRAAFQHDAYGRNILGTPPQGRADYAFFQHILASMDKQTGRCAILFPHGVLFRDEEKEMRQKLVEMDKIECIIGMGANLFFNSPMEASIVICRSQKADARKGKILFINAIKEVVRKNGESYLEDAHIEKIVSAYNNDEDVPFFSKWVRNEDIQDASLNIVQYVQPEEIVTTRQILSVEATEQAWKTQSRDIQSNINDLQKLLAL
jgi:type I restriction enzyme M protein